MAKRSLRYQGREFEISYEILNPTQARSIIFLHGWGSNKEVMKTAFAHCFEHMRHLYIDLPGFGRSPNQHKITTHDYAQILALFLHSLGFPMEFVVGHSFGGKIATLLNPPFLVLLSSAGIIWPKSLGVRSRIIFAKILKAIKISNTLLRSKDAQGLNPAMYEVFKSVVDEDFSSVFAACSSKTLLLWGKDDLATPLKSGEKIASLIQKSHLEVMEGDHYFFLSQGRNIQEKLLQWSEND